jgi:hypothetical protein
VRWRSENKNGIANNRQKAAATAGPNWPDYLSFKLNDDHRFHCRLIGSFARCIGTPNRFMKLIFVDDRIKSQARTRNGRKRESI